LQITRRKFCQTTATLALATSMVGFASLPPFRDMAFAETVPTDELMKPEGLPDMAMGNDKASVTVIEYASMTCPHCAHFQEVTFPELKKRYIDTGKVRYIFREFPLDSLAAAAFMLARCAGKDDKDKYFALVDTLFRQQR
jgi:protein-disulfide isomerase